MFFPCLQTIEIRVWGGFGWSRIWCPRRILRGQRWKRPALKWERNLNYERWWYQKHLQFIGMQLCGCWVSKMNGNARGSSSWLYVWSNIYETFLIQILYIVYGQCMVGLRSTNMASFIGLWVQISIDRSAGNGGLVMCFQHDSAWLRWRWPLFACLITIFLRWSIPEIAIQSIQSQIKSCCAIAVGDQPLQSLTCPTSSTCNLCLRQIGWHLMECCLCVIILLWFLIAWLLT